ncbi:hypothetical protein [Sphingobium sp. SCG-1]|nr:hypothetical protein [Sphingobium sp. SCG-1]
MDEEPKDDEPRGDEDGICPKCRGTGMVDGVTCPRCDGSGKLTEGIGGG